MELDIIRKEFYDNSTIGNFCIDGNVFSYSLEDKDRQVSEGGVIIPWKKELKVPGSTAIPYGRYQVIITQSTRFKRRMPLLLRVPDFEGIRIHNGVTHLNTEGCPLIGYDRINETLTKESSRKAFYDFFDILDNVLKEEDVYINIRQQIIGA